MTVGVLAVVDGVVVASEEAVEDLEGASEEAEVLAVEALVEAGDLNSTVLKPRLDRFFDSIR